MIETKFVLSAIYVIGGAISKVVISNPSELIWQMIFRIVYDFKKSFFKGMAKPT